MECMKTCHHDNSNQTTAQVRYYVSVNANSKNKQLAYDSAKAMMDLAVNDNIGYNFPISKINFDEWITRLESSDNKTQIDGNFIVGDFDVEKVRQVAENIQHVTLNDISVMTIVNDGMAPYIEGDTKTFDECYEETVNKLNLYINE